MATKKGQLMAFLTVEDLFDQIEVVVFPKTFEKCRDCLEPDNIVVMKGKLDLKEDGNPKLIADSVVKLEDYSSSSVGSVRSSKPVEIPMVKIIIPESFSEEEALIIFKRLGNHIKCNINIVLFWLRTLSCIDEYVINRIRCINPLKA